MPNELTNPTNVVTEERLAQFYQQILPYMGGMPDILANKFSKADLYSTDEKLIGRWIDGKPIYQRVVTGIGDTYQNWNQVVLSSDVNVNQVIDAKIISSDRVGIDGGGFTSIVAAVVESTGTVNLYNSISHTNANTAYAIQYTKTIDSTIEIGDDTDYSTTEKIVGTWIDGKPLYQKTLNCGALPNNTTKNVAHGISDLAYVVSCEGFALNPTSNIQWPLPFISTGSSKGIGVSVSATNVELSTDYDRSGYTYTYVTIQYTKTSS